MPSFHSIHFGCRANQADAAAIEADLSGRGFLSAGGVDSADIVVLNSCTVTAAADAELRQTVRRIHRSNPAAKIVVTGCYAQRRPEEVAALPGVQWVVGNSHKHELGRLVATCAAQPSSGSWVPLERLAVSDSAGPGDAVRDSDLLPLGLTAPDPIVLVGDISRQREFSAAAFFGGAVEDRARPNIKIQDGCNNRCSFCIIPVVRGPSRSLRVDEVVRQISSLAAAGFREVVISGVNLGQYGRDLPGRPRFLHVIKAILRETSVERLRLSSVEPLDYTEELLDLIASTPRVARHIHAPLQSGSNRVLRRMHRKYTAAKYRERILSAWRRLPDAAFGADVIVGFPGESDDDFEQTRLLIDSLPFTYLHVFPFSRRPGTPADAMGNQVNGAVVRERARVLRALASEKNARFRRRHLGGVLQVLTFGQRSPEGRMGISDNYLRVLVQGDGVPSNEWVSVRATGMTQDGLVGCSVDQRQPPQDAYESVPSSRP